MFFHVNEHTLHVATAGEPELPPLVLLHSLGTSSAVWEAQVSALAGRRYVICPDFRGHGLSAESTSPLTCEVLAEDILALLDEMGIGAFALAGISLGGAVAQLVAARAGSRATGLAVFGSYVVSLNPPMWQERAAKVRADGLASIIPAMLKIWMTEEEVSTVKGTGLRRMLETASSEGYAAACDALAVMDNRAAVPSIACPAVVVAGAEDRAAPVAASEAVVAAIPGARLEIIDGAAHIPLLHHAARCTEIIRQIL